MIGSEKALYKRWNGSGDAARSPHAYEALSPPGQGFFGSPPVLQHQTSSCNSSWSSEDEDGCHLVNPNGSPNTSTGVLCDVISRKTLFHLISTLNAAFPDYEFSSASSSEFSKENHLQTVVNSVDNLLSITAMDHYSKVRHELWRTLNEEIRLQDCDIYSYTPDQTSDPFVEDGCLWSFNYFFYNRKMKRVVLFTCRAQSPFSGQSWYDSPTEDDEMVFED
jgi:hypothetical protein